MKTITTTALLLGLFLTGAASQAHTAYAGDLEKAAPAQAAQQTFDLAFRYDNGLGVHTDRTKAARLYRQAAEQGSSDAMFYLSQLYLRGDGVPQDKVQAYKWLKAAEEKNPSLGEARLALEAGMPPSRLEMAKRD